MAYATVEQYLERYPDCTAASGTIAALLEDASDAIDGAIAPFDYDTEANAGKLSRTCCAIAHRAIPSGGAAGGAGMLAGATQASQTAGSYTLSASFASGYGEVYLTKSDRLKLGIGDGRYAYAEPYGGADVPD